MKRNIKWKAAAAAVIFTLSITGCGKTQTSELQHEENNDSVIVVIGPTSEPEAGFDPAYGWGAGEHVHEPLIQSTLTVTQLI